MDDKRLKALIISYAFSPNAIVGARRMSTLSGVFREHGIDSDVLTVKEEYCTHIDGTLSTGADLTVRTPVTLAPTGKRGSGFVLRLGAAIRRLARKRFYSLDAWQGWTRHMVGAGKRMIQRNSYDLLLVSGPPFSSFIGAFRLSVESGIPLFLDYRDAWTAYDWKKVIPEKARLAEKEITNHATGIILCTETMRRFYLNAFPELAGDRITVITNGFSPGDMPEKPSSDTVIRIGHAGTFYGERSLSVLIDPVKRMIKDGKSVEVYHWGSLPDAQRNAYNKAGISDSLRIHGRTDHDSLIENLAEMDVLAAFSGTDVTYAIPYKIFDYLSTGKPILAITPEGSELARFIGESTFGRVADASSTDEIALQLSSCLEMPSYDPPKEHTWKRKGEAYSSFLREMLSNKARK